MAQSNFAACLPITLAYEGGFTKNPKDPGNWTGGKVGRGALRGTNMGIAASSHPTLDILNLTRDQAAKIYEAEYWRPAGCEALRPGLDLVHFDGTVNSGSGRSVKWLRKALESGASADAIRAYSNARLASLHSFGAWATFGKGWAARVAGVEAKAISMLTSNVSIADAAKDLIASAGASAASKAKAASTIAHAATAVAGGGAAIAPTHTTAGIITAVLGLAVAVWSHFHASTSGARAAVLAHAAADG